MHHKNASPDFRLIKCKKIIANSLIVLQNIEDTSFEISSVKRYPFQVAKISINGIFHSFRRAISPLINEPGMR
jgi:hypothetical protein